MAAKPRGRPPRRPKTAPALAAQAIPPEEAGADVMPRQDRSRVTPRLARQRAERLARGDNDRSGTLTLGVDETKLDTDNFVYRFANEEEGGRRLHQLLTQKDYEVVSSGDMTESTDDLGSGVARTIGQLKDGSPNRAVLVRKPKDWYEADKAQDRRPNDEAMSAIKRGVVPSGNAGGATLTARDRAYIPEEGISISVPSRSGGFTP